LSSSADPLTGTASNWCRNVLRTATIAVTAGRAKYGADDVANYYPRPEVAIEVPLG
jgi:hypothetical protein